MSFEFKDKKQVEKDEPLFTIHAETHGELNYALDYVVAQNNIITISGGDS